MKKACAWILSLALVCAAMGVWAEGDSLFETLAGLEWSFSSGVGGWSTDMRMQADGSFTGEYHDSEMGETGDDYPYGTLYGCSFNGQMAVVEQVDENTWKLRVERLEMDEGQVPEAIEDGIRFVTAEPYGLSEGDEMLLYRPGTPVNVLSESMLFWAHIIGREDPPSALDAWFLSSEKNDSGFVGFDFQPGTSMANPWEDMTAEQLLAASGLAFRVPEGAENVIYRFLPSQGLAEMQFTLDADEYCARIQPAALQEGEWLDISGMYFDWVNEEAVAIRGCRGTIAQAQDGDEGFAELCQWYDAAAGRMHSLSVYTADLDGLDLTAVAEQVYLPAPGDS